MLITARDNGYAVRDQDRTVLQTVAQYRKAVREFAGMANLAVWYAHLDIETRDRRPLAADRAAARTRTRGRRGGWVEELHRLLRAYRASLEHDRRVLLEQFELMDFARKVVGVGSVGTRDRIGLLFGRDGFDPLFLQLKQAEASVLEEYVGWSQFKNHGERVVTGQRLMQAASDIFLGWVHVKSGIDGVPCDFYGRQLKEWKGSAEVEQMTPKGMSIYGQLCGWTLARARARADPIRSGR